MTIPQDNKLSPQEQGYQHDSAYEYFVMLCKKAGVEPSDENIPFIELRQAGASAVPSVGPHAKI